MNSVLLVEDTTVLAEQIADMLRMEGYRVVIAINGVDALTKLKSFNPALVITDLLMPEMDGFELIRRMRKDASFTEVPIIILSAKSAEEIDLANIGTGIAGFLRKPCLAEDLVDKVKITLAARNSAQEIQQAISC
jgi:DNA-binding response OmpR family regulator